MRITITARYFDLNEDLKYAIRARLAKIESQFEGLSRANIVVTQEAHYQFHVNLKVDGHGQFFHATATDYQLPHAIDTAVRHIRAQASKFRQKTQERFKHRLSQKALIENLERHADSSDGRG